MSLIPVHAVRRSAAAHSRRVLETAAMFGIDLDARRTTTIIEPTRVPVPLEAGGVVFVTGPSGGGKSTLLAELAKGCADRGRAIVKLSSNTSLPDRPLVDQFDDLALPEAIGLLARAGLGEARVLLRRPRELSVGQRARLALARTMHEAAKAREPAVIIADELGATLDRLTAHIVARHLQRWARRTGRVVIVATTHDELLEPLAPDVVVWIGLAGEVEVMTR